MLGCLKHFTAQHSEALFAVLQEEDSPEVADLKEQLLALMLAMSERLDAVEAVQEQHQGAIEVCLQITSIVRTCLLLHKH